jgi:hypothetical protein
MAGAGAESSVGRCADPTLHRPQASQPARPLAHAPQRLHDEVSADYNDMIYAASPAEIEERGRAFFRKWRLKCKAVADSLEEADDRLFTFTGLPRSQWKSARTTDEIDKLFFAGSLAHVGTGWACGTARRSAFCPSKARWQRGYWDAALSTPTAAGGGGRRPAFTKPHPSSDNRPWRSRGCSVQRQSGWIAHCPLRTQFGAVVSSACTGDRGAKSKAGG